MRTASRCRHDKLVADSEPTTEALRWVSRGILALILSGLAVLGAMLLLREDRSRDALAECSQACSHGTDLRIPD